MYWIRVTFKVKGLHCQEFAGKINITLQAYVPHMWSHLQKVRYKFSCIQIVYFQVKFVSTPYAFVNARLAGNCPSIHPRKPVSVSFYSINDGGWGAKWLTSVLSPIFNYQLCRWSQIVFFIQCLFFIWIVQALFRH